MFKSDDSEGYMSADLPQNSIDVAVRNGSKSYAHVNGNHHVYSAMSPPLKSANNVRYGQGAPVNNWEASYQHPPSFVAAQPIVHTANFGQSTVQRLNEGFSPLSR
jgi:hypothetical protein